MSFRLIDTETSQIVVNRTELAGNDLDPVAMSARLAQFVSFEILNKYPVKGRLVAVDNQEVILNLGKKNGLIAGDTFKVLGEGTTIEFNGKVIGRRETPLGVLRVSSVEDQMAVAVMVNKTGAWAPNMRVVDTRVDASK